MQHEWRNKHGEQIDRERTQNHAISGEKPSGLFFYFFKKGSVKTIYTAFLICLTLAMSSCIGVGYSSRGGWFVWPGGLGLLLIVIVLVLLFRRRR